MSPVHSELREGCTEGPVSRAVPFALGNSSSSLVSMEALTPELVKGSLFV